jgi:hypothetical protein
VVKLLALGCKFIFYYGLAEIYYPFIEILSNLKIYRAKVSIMNYSNNFFSFLIYIFKVDYVYCWWWHTSILQIFTAKILTSSDLSKSSLTVSRTVTPYAF